MRRAWRRKGVVVSLFVALSLVPAGPVRATETVALAFGWPSGLHGKVTFSARTTQTVNGRSEDLDLTGRYDFMTSAAADGLLIRFDNVEADVANAGSGPQAMIKKYMARAISTPPSYVVSPEGEFVRIEGLETFRDQILAGLDDAFAQLPAEAREQLVQTMSSIVTREQLEASLASEWGIYVGAWIGAELDQGDFYELAFSEPVPAFGNMEVPMRSTFRFKGRVACTGAESARRCVELEMRTVIDPEGLAAAVQAFIARLPGGDRAPHIRDMQQETLVRLISEPETLLPHLMESLTRTVTTMAVGDGAQVSSRTEEKRFLYTY